VGSTGEAPVGPPETEVVLYKYSHTFDVSGSSQSDELIR